MYTDNMIKEIREYLQQGKSYGRIAINMTNKYKVKFTRNMIIGKVWRLRRAGVSI